MTHRFRAFLEIEEMMNENTHESVFQEKKRSRDHFGHLHSFAATDLEPNLILFQLRGNLKDCNKNLLSNIFFMSSQ